MSKKLFIKTYGCQMNVYDSLKMQELLEPFNFMITDNLGDADLAILNTCHIREKATEKMYSELGRIKEIKDNRNKNGLDMLIAVAGCVAQAEGEEIFARTPYVDIVVGPQSYHTLPSLIADILRSKKHLINLDFVENEKFDKLPTEGLGQGASAFVSVQEGCDKFCTFCVVPYTRGAEFSRDVSSIIREVVSLVGKGAKEIYFVGQNVNAYHGALDDGRQVSLADLIEYVSQISGVERIRYTTSHPLDMKDDLIKLHGSEKKLMPFLHLPVQSGSNKILKSMNRKHTKEEYLDIVAKLKSQRNDIVLSSDFIVGFPGETDEDFADTLDIVKKVEYGQCFSFKYSPRPGTPAASMTQVPEDEKKKRLDILQKEITNQQLKLNSSMVGKVLPVLFTKSGKFDGQFVGKTPYMQSVFVSSLEDDLIGKILDVSITGVFSNGMSGELAHRYEFSS